MISSLHTKEGGSALLVTIMLTSVTILFSIILLERVIPYARKVQGLEGSLQAYYAAKSEVEMAQYIFSNNQKRDNSGDTNRIGPTTTPEIIELAYPKISKTEKSTHVIVSKHFELPLKIRQFEKDDAILSFGTDMKNPNYHGLISFGGGLLFDLSELGNRGGAPFSMITSTDNAHINTTGNINVEFINISNGKTDPFFGTVGETPVRSIHGKNIKDATDKNRPPERDTLSYLMNLLGECRNASCALKLRLSDSESYSIPVRFSLSNAIPDLHAILIADGLSHNATYHSRIIKLIPNTQSL